MTASDTESLLHEDIYQEEQYDDSLEDELSNESWDPLGIKEPPWPRFVANPNPDLVGQIFEPIGPVGQLSGYSSNPYEATAQSWHSIPQSYPAIAAFAPITPAPLPMCTHSAPTLLASRATRPTLLLAPALETSDAPSKHMKVVAPASFMRPMECEIDQKPVPDENATTVMIRNLPSHITQQCLVDDLDRCGSEGTYDFLYMPQSFDTNSRNCVKGFAFINFIQPSSARALTACWHGQRRFGAREPEPGLNISAADIQGKEANLRKWAKPRLRRIRNPKLRPFVRDDCSQRLCCLPGEGYP